MHTGRIPIRSCLWLCARVRLNNADSAGGCVSAGLADCATFGEDFYCGECTTDLCNSTAGLSVGALSMVILGTVMQVLA